MADYVLSEFAATQWVASWRASFGHSLASAMKVRLPSIGQTGGSRDSLVVSSCEGAGFLRACELTRPLVLRIEPVET